MNYIIVTRCVTAQCDDDRFENPMLCSAIFTLASITTYYIGTIIHLFISNDVLQVSVFPAAQTGHTARTRTRHPRTDGRAGSVRRAM